MPIQKEDYGTIVDQAESCRSDERGGMQGNSVVSHRLFFFGHC